MQRRPDRDRLSVGELERIAETAEAIAEDYGERPSDDRRQVRRLAKIVADLARHLQQEF